MERKLRINWILARPSLAGGVKSNRLIAEAMVRRGHNVNIAYIKRKPKWPRFWHIRQLARRIVEEIHFLGKNNHHLMSSTANLIPVNDYKIKHEHVPDADISIAGFWITREWINDWPRSKGLKGYFIRHHELHAGDPERVKDTYRSISLQFVIATWLQKLMKEEYGSSESVLVPNGVDWLQFNSSPRDRNPLPVVGMLYGVQEWKGAQAAFKAVKIVRERIPGVKLIAFGSKPVLKKHDPPDDFTFLLQPEQNEISKIYKSTDCWIVPSTTEGFGMPGIEAAACRCPLVATKCGGPEDYVEEGVNGHLVPVNDYKAMAEAIISIIQLPDEQWKRMSEASYQIARRFDWNVSAEILENAIIKKLQDDSMIKETN